MGDQRPQHLYEFGPFRLDTRERVLLRDNAYAVSGQRDAALKVLKELQDASRQEYVAPFCIALVYTGLGESEQAFEWLEKACDVRSWGLLWLKVDPRFDRLRPDTRFAALLDRIGLAP